MPTTQNPTPGGGGGDGAMDVDPDAWVDDLTGMHPTATTFATTVVESSLTVGDEEATPTFDAYHKIELGSNVEEFNLHVANYLRFSDVEETWSNYNNHVEDYSQSQFTDGTVNPHLWVEGFRPRYSWDYTSVLTGNEYVNLCPTIIFHANNQSQYYFFREVFDDFQAIHGWANWSLRKDGYPGFEWPGMIRLYRSSTSTDQLPKRYRDYEKWFGTTYGKSFSFAAPYVSNVNTIPATAPPTRPRFANPSREPRDEPLTVHLDVVSEDDGDDTAEVVALRAAAASRA